MSSKQQRRWQAAYDQTMRRLEVECGEGSRNNDLYRAATFLGRFVDFEGFNKKSVETELIQTGTALGLPEKEAATTVKRGMMYGAHARLSPDREDEPQATETWHELCARKHLDPDRTAIRWDVRSTKKHGQPAIAYPVGGRDRIRVLTVPKAVPSWLARGPFDDLYTSFPLGSNPSDVPVYVVNGETGVWACEAAGVDACCTCVGETPNGLSERRVSILAALCRPVRIVGDADAAGRKFALAAQAQLVAAGVDAVALSVGLDKRGADVGDLFVLCGADLPAVLASLTPLMPPTDAPADEDSGPLFDVSAPRFCQKLPGLVVPPSMAIPDGYAVSAGGVWRIPKDKEKDPERISTGPIVVTGRMRDEASGEEYTELSYRRPASDAWERMVVRRDEVMISRKAAELTAQGLPITSGTAGSFCAWAAVCEESLAETGDEVRTTTSTMGWHGPAFLRGEHVHGDPCPDYRGAAEIGPIIRSIHEAGSQATWVEHVWPILQKYPVIRAAVAASCVAPLLAMLRCEAFALDICGETSLGKTTTLRVVASAWGAPEYMRTWAATRVGIERLACAMTGHPLLLDDTKRADRPEQCGSVVYDIVAGEGKTRGTITGLQPITRFQTVVLSTGEGPLSTMMTDAGGLRARCLTLWGSPLGGHSAEAEDVAITIPRVTAEHYGHAGRALIDWLVARSPKARATLVERYHEEQRRYSEQASRHPVKIGPRLASHAAAISVAGRCLEAALGMTPAMDWMPAALFSQAVLSGASADRAREAMDTLLSWILTQRSSIYQAHGQAPPPRGQWLGAISAGRLYVSIDDADRRLNGYSLGEIRSSWKERGWIQTDARHVGRRVSIEGAQVRMYAITDQALADCGATLSATHEYNAAEI